MRPTLRSPSRNAPAVVMSVIWRNSEGEYPPPLPPRPPSSALTFGLPFAPAPGRACGWPAGRQSAAMQGPANLKPLTSLRFVAAMWVVLFHYWPHLAVAGTPPLVAKGYLGVECFFVLSGFILCHVYLPSFEAGRFKYGDFLWARIARIYPLHIATLVAMGLMAGVALAAGLPVDPDVLSLPALPANLTLTQAWGLSPVAGWNHPSWSISAEWFAYLSFPAFAFLAIKVRRWP